MPENIKTIENLRGRAQLPYLVRGWAGPSTSTGAGILQRSQPFAYANRSQNEYQGQETRNHSLFILGVSRVTPTNVLNVLIAPNRLRDDAKVDNDEGGLTNKVLYGGLCSSMKTHIQTLVEQQVHRRKGTPERSIHVLEHGRYRFLNAPEPSTPENRIVYSP